jgi:hypothetical protein
MWSYRTRTDPVGTFRLEGRFGLCTVHEVDTFTTLAKIGGAEVPKDRQIDGVDQSDFLLAKSEKSNREGFPVFVADRLEAVKWRNWKMVFYDEQRDWWTPPTKLGVPKLSTSSLTRRRSTRRRDFGIRGSRPRP